MLVRPGGDNHPNGQERHGQHLDAREALAPEVAGGQGGDAPAGAQDDVDGDGDVVAEGMVVQDVDGEEQEDVDEPAADGDAVRSEEEGRPAGIELGDVAGDGHEDELDEGQEGSWGDVSMGSIVEGVLLHTAFRLDLDDGFESKDLEDCE